MKLPKYTHAFVDRFGKARFYLRAPGRKRIALPGLPWSPEFMAAREQGLKDEWGAPAIGAGRTKPGSVNAALIGYYQSSAFRDGLAKNTQNYRRAILERFREKCGHLPVATMPKDALQRIFENLTPASARNWKNALRGFLDYCLANNLLAVDPLAGVKLVKVKSKSHHPWDVEECEHFEAAYPVGTRERLAYELLLQAGQARCDVIRMGRQHVRDGMLSMKRQKTDVPFNVQVTPRLQAAIEALPPSNQLTFLLTEKSEPFASAASFGNWFRGACREAKMPARCTPHGLRAAAAIYFAEKGATDHQLMAWFGWTSISQAQVYTKGANRKRMAIEAGKLISGTGIGKPQTQFANIGGNPLKSQEGKT
ncbi:tyrosine-type recombinase/integrase [Bradyrhizobium sp. 4]|uniref:tyrosine-type recombinase/integrase n=1 Tax=unclassified Bradyrhizobium TaxID=2631580 RepID=UPI001FFB4FF6|nr:MULTISPECIES: tyrosine-type recombinase/integrase [unclassified Bradyrhizobium]MCK1401961.1 tyrosine-type recombinase/integrase [Bradyrhizobium sp. 39]MCK1751319.1 tyrosine-type recombinase/integrase [Bradyrhizobium sp. 135]UPJ38567.1 tyrosine-type recombinase/integrase [Bradyrhizobium sp. 4]